MAQYWDAPSIYTTTSRDDTQSIHSGTTVSASRSHLNNLQTIFTQFLTDPSSSYRDQLLKAYNTGRYWILLLGSDLQTYHQGLYDALRSNPTVVQPLFEGVVKKFLTKLIKNDLASNPTATDSMDQTADEEPADAPHSSRSGQDQIPDIQIVLKTDMDVTSIRSLSASVVSKLIKINGIVTGSSTLQAKATDVCLMCRSCRHIKYVHVEAGLTGIQLPRSCERKTHDSLLRHECPMDPYYIVHERSRFVDQRLFQVQELPEAIPIGEMPRRVQCVANRYLVHMDKIVPGTKVEILGAYSIHASKSIRDSASSGIKIPYIRVYGLSTIGNSAASAKAGNEEEYRRIARSGNVLDRLARSFAPSIMGHEEVKKSIICQLFGGTQKQPRNGFSQRSDIHVLLLGDPGVAKSQLLKFVQQVAPIGVYTSGKGSSAAGLTAAVIRSPQSGEFYLEAGAMFLADGGVVCIDEFDKMREEDRVAIHEAMEQQTISIAKAGITTILNTRASVLAAANPRPGRYDDQQTAEENIDFQTTILSRFDMIYLLRDTHDEKRDQTLAKHVIDVQVNYNPATGRSSAAGRNLNSMANGTDTGDELSIEMMRGYVDYCRRTCAPKLSMSALQTLSNFYVAVRKEVKAFEEEQDSQSVIPITVRQLEAIVRISESIAKMELAMQVETHHCQAAIRLFRKSTEEAVSSGRNAGADARETRKARHMILERLPVGSTTSTDGLRKFITGKGIEDKAAGRAVSLLVNQGILQFRGQKSVYRAARG